MLSKETSRAGMTVDMLTKWLHEPGTILSLKILLEGKEVPYPLVVGAGLADWGMRLFER